MFFISRFHLEKKLDESSLEKLFQSLRSNPLCQTCTNDEILDAILRKKDDHSFIEIVILHHLDHHRDSSPRPRLLAFINQTIDCSLIDKQRTKANIDKYDSVDVDINELLIKPWCARFCPRCYTYKYNFGYFLSSVHHFVLLVVYYIKKVHHIYHCRNEFPFQ